MAQTTMTFRVDDSLKKDFDKLCDEFGLSNTAALTIFMKTMVRERRIPFEIRTEPLERWQQKDALHSGLAEQKQEETV